MIQLQYLDEITGENLGGLYVIGEDISAVRNSRGDDLHSCVITLKCGKEFLIPWSIMEILDELFKGRSTCSGSK